MYTRQNQIPIQNNNINNNIKIHEKTQNINQINILYNKSSIIQREGKDEALNDHRPIPMKSAEKAKLSICKISYHYNNKTTLGTGFFTKYSDTLKLLITNYHVIYPELMNINFDLIVFVFGEVYKIL